MRSLASSITTLLPLTTTIPILFCVFCKQNNYKSDTFSQRNFGDFADGRYLLGELDGIVQDEVHEGIEATQGALNLEAYG